MRKRDRACSLVCRSQQLCLMRALNDLHTLSQRHVVTRRNDMRLVKSVRDNGRRRKGRREGERKREKERKRERKREIKKTRTREMGVGTAVSYPFDDPSKPFLQIQFPFARARKNIYFSCLTHQLFEHHCTFSLRSFHTTESLAPFICSRERSSLTKFFLRFCAMVLLSN